MRATKLLITAAAGVLVGFWLSQERQRQDERLRYARILRPPRIHNWRPSRVYQADLESGEVLEHEVD